MNSITAINDLDLAQIDMFDQAFWRDPFTTYDAARQKHPWLARYAFGHLLLDYASMKAFLRDPRCREPNRDITLMWQAQGTPFARFNDHQLVSMDGPEHKRLRDFVAPAFTPRAAAKHRPLMREVFQEVLASLGNTDHCDINDVASHYPITVMCDLIGIARSDMPKFIGWLDVMEAAFGQDAAILPSLNEACAAMFDYVSNVIAKRREPGDHPDDLLQSLVDLAHEGVQLTDEELRSLLILLLGAGFDTTKNQLNLIMKIFIDHPEYREQCATDPEFAKKVIEESLRFKTPIGALHRITNEDIVFNDVLFPANTFVSIPVTYSGRDPAMNACPHTFDPNREKVNQIAFGQGIHMCLGQYLARGLLEEAVPLMAAHFVNPRHDGEPVMRSPFGIWGYRSLPIAFEPGTKRA